jgi:hypothetical protein
MGLAKKCLRDLTSNPLDRWILCDVNPDEVSASYPNDDECIAYEVTPEQEFSEIAVSNQRSSYHARRDAFPYMAQPIEMRRASDGRTPIF